MSRLSRSRRPARLALVTAVAAVAVVGVLLWGGGRRYGRVVGREYAGNVDGVGPVVVRIEDRAVGSGEPGSTKGGLAGSLLTNGSGRAVGIRGMPVPGGGFEVRVAEWEKGAATAGEMMRLESRAEGAPLGGLWRKVPDGVDRRFALPQLAEVRRRRGRRGFSVWGYGASLELEARWPVYAGAGPHGSIDLNRAVLDRIDRWFADRRSRDSPDWWAGLRERAMADEWQGSLWVETVWAEGEVVSLHVLDYAYTGGGHGMTSNGGWTFVRDGNRWGTVLLPDLFRPGSAWRTRLSREAAARLRAAGASWVPDDPEVEDGRTFTIAPGGLRLYFDPYEVGSYAEGTYVVWLPWNRLADLLREAWRARLSASPEDGPPGI